MGSGGAHWWCTTIRLKMVRCWILVGKEWELVILVIVLSNQMVRYTPCGFKDDAHLSWKGCLGHVRAQSWCAPIRCWDPPVAPQGTPTNSYHFSNWLSFSNRQRLIQNLKQRITLINENLKRRCIFQLKFWNNAVCRCHFKKSDAVAAVSEVFLLQEEIWRTICNWLNLKVSYDFGFNFVCRCHCGDRWALSNVSHSRN